MTDLPKGWANARLPDFCDIEMGQAPSSSSYNTLGEGLPLYQGKAEFGSLFPTPKKYCTEPNKIGAEGSILLSVRAPVGPTNLAPHKCGIGRGLAAILPLSGIPNRFVLWAIRKQEASISAQATGSTFTAISKSHVHAISMALPPLNEQRRIVARIEAMFDQIDHGVEALKTARKTLGLYRQSLLKAAFEGRLTAHWRAQNADKLETPETLLTRIQKERDTRYKSALDDWQKALTTWREGGEKGKKPAKPKRPPQIDMDGRVTLASVVFDVSQGWSPKCKSDPSYSDATWGVIKTTAIQPARFNAFENKELPDALEPREHLELIHGDVLITRAGPRKRVGVACMVKETRPRLMLCDKAYRLRLEEKFISPEFLEGFLNAPQTQDKLESLKSGINDSGLNLKQEQFLSLGIWLPPPAEQAEITRILDARLSAADALEAEIAAALTRAEALRQSILKQAFSGKLVPQDPNDEPASILLERIKAEKAKAPKARRTRKAIA